MPKASHKDRLIRYLQIIKYMETEPRTIKALQEKTGASKSCVEKDLAYLQRAFPLQCKRNKATNHNENGVRAVFSWTGQPPYLLNGPLYWLSEQQLVALIAARGILDPHLGNKNNTQHSLSHAIQHLIDRADIEDDVRHIENRVIDVSEHGAEKYDPQQLHLCISAISCSDFLQFDYQSIKQSQENAPAKPRHIKPMRLRMINSEWYLLGVDETIKTFKVSRIKNAIRVRHSPNNFNTNFDTSDINSRFNSAFYATSSDKTHRIVLKCNRSILPLIQDRHWGRNTVVNKSEDDRFFTLEFTTTGLDECKHWVLGFGSEIKVIAPAELKSFVSEEARKIKCLYEKE